MTPTRVEPASTVEAVLADLAGVGGYRPVHAVWQLACVLTTMSDLRIGGSDDDEPVDLVLHRDPDTGRVELRGSTVAGVLRHELDERLQGYPSQAPGSRAVGPDRPEHAAVRALFGGAGDDDLASPLTVFDATVEGPIAITGGDGESGGEPETRAAVRYRVGPLHRRGPHRGAVHQ